MLMVMTGIHQYEWAIIFVGGACDGGEWRQRWMLLLQ